MERIFKIKFLGFFPSFNEKDNFFIDAINRIGKAEVSDNPDYVFYSVFNEEYLLYPDVVRIFFTGENVAPNFQLCDYAIGFERLEFGDRYLRFPFYYGMDEYSNDLRLASKKHQNVTDKMYDREFCSFVYSNSDADSMRLCLFDALSEYKKVDAGGALRNNLPHGPVQDKRLFERQYKFSIACENSSHYGYVTEKILQSFAAQTIPIYYGDPSIESDFNPRAFINCHDYNSLDEVIQVIGAIDQDKNKYLEMLRQPAFRRDEDMIEYQNQLQQFIENIFSQEYTKAFRRNRVFWGKKIDEKYKKIYKVELKIQKLRRFLKRR